MPAGNHASRQLLAGPDEAGGPERDSISGNIQLPEVNHCNSDSFLDKLSGRPGLDSKIYRSHMRVAAVDIALALLLKLSITAGNRRLC